MSKKIVHVLSIIIISVITVGTGVYYFTSSNAKADSACYTDHHGFDEWKEIKEKAVAGIKGLKNYEPCYNTMNTAINAAMQANQDRGATKFECGDSYPCCSKSREAKEPGCTAELQALQAHAHELMASCEIIEPKGLRENCDEYSGPYCDNRYPWHQINTEIEDYIASKENYLNDKILPAIAKLEKTCNTGAVDPVVVEDIIEEEVVEEEVEEEEEIDRDIQISVENNNLAANGITFAAINILVTNKKGNSNNDSDNSVKITLTDSGSNSAKKGVLSATNASLDANGRTSFIYTAPAIGDPDFKGGTVGLEITIDKKTFNKSISLVPAPQITGKVVNIEGAAFPNVPIKYFCYKDTGGKFSNELSSNEKGEFSIPGIANKNCVINVGYKFRDYITINKKNIQAPFALGTLTLATKREFEKDTATRIINMLVKSGISKAEANEMINNITFDYESGGPEFFIEEPTWIREKLGSPAWASLRIPSEQYWANAEWDTIFHEYGHVVMKGFAYDEDAEVGKDHDLWLKTNRDTAFDEARAHFFSILMLRETGRNGEIADEFTEDNALSSTESEQVEGNRIEGVITTFWEKVYGDQIYISPDSVMKDFMDVQNKFRDEKGRPPRTVEEWIEGEKMLRQGDRIYQIANDLKINHKGSIEVGLDADTKVPKITLEIEEGGEMGIVYGGIGAERMITGQTELNVKEEIETKNSNGRVIFPDGSYIKLRPGSKTQVLNENMIIIRNGKSLIRVFKRDNEFQIVSPESDIIINVKGTTLETVVDENGNSIVKLIEGEIEITDMENNHLETLVAGQQYNSETKEVSEFNSDESLVEWEEATEADYIKETKKSPFVFFLIIGLIIAGAIAFVVIKKRKQLGV